MMVSKNGDQVAPSSILGDLNKHSIMNSSHQTSNKFMNMQNNQAGSHYQNSEALKPNTVLMNRSVMAVPAPLRAGCAPQMGLREEKAQLPVVDTKGDVSSLQVVEYYLDDQFVDYTEKVGIFGRPKFEV